jgi:hypothetical protein
MGRDRAWVITQSNSASALGRTRLPTLRQGSRPEVPAAVGLASLSTSDGSCPLHEWKGRRSARRIKRGKRDCLTAPAAARWRGPARASLAQCTRASRLAAVPADRPPSLEDSVLRFAIGIVAAYALVLQCPLRVKLRPRLAGAGCQFAPRKQTSSGYTLRSGSCH